jgi:hypothetical protein
MWMPPWKTTRLRLAATPRHTISDAVSRAMCSMPRTGVDVAATVAEQHAVGGQLRVVAFQAHVELMPAQGGAQFQVDAAVPRVAGQHGVGAQERGGARAVGLHAGMRKHGILGQVDVHQGVVQMRGIAGMQVMLDHAQRSTGTQFDQVAVVPGQVGVAGRADEDQLQRGFGPARRRPRGPARLRRRGRR